MGLQTYLPVEILDYVQTHEPPEDVAYGISQRELAKALGYHPCSMSRPLDQLVREGLLDAHRGLVRDGRRKQLTYRLTADGRTRLKRETKEVPLLSGDLPPPPHPFLGRGEELAQLAEFSQAGTSVTLVDGPPGMGKTALVSRHMRRARRGRVPFWFTVRPASSPRQFVSALSHALSFLGNPQLAYYAQLPRNPVAKETADLAARALGSQTVVVVVDDFHSAGPDLRIFLSDFVSSLASRGGHQFYIVGQDAALFEAGSVPTHRLTVVGLDRAAAHELTDRRGGLADRFETVYQSTLGSPLLLQLAVSNPEIHADATTLPEAVVKRLPPEEIRAVLPVALANEPLPTTLLTEEFGLSASRLQELLRMGIVHKALEDRVEVLQVVRSAILSRAGPGFEREAHLALARFYGRSHRPETMRERFLHLVAGEDWKAASRLLDEQQRVVLRLGYSETLRNSLRHLAVALPAGTAKVRVLIAEASLLRHHSDYADAIQVLRRAIAESEGDRRIKCEALLSIVDLHLRLAEPDQARIEFEAARRIGALTRRLQAFFLLSEGRLIEGQGESQEASTKYQEAFELARRAHATDLALESIAAWSRLAYLTGGPEIALQVIDAAAPEARRAGRMDIVFNLLLVRARAYLDTGRGDLAEREMNAIRSEAEAMGYLNQLTYTLSGLAAVAIENGRWAEGSAYAKQTSALAERLGNDMVLGYTLAMLCSSEFRQADQGGDLRLLDEAIAHGNRSIEVLGRLPPSDSMVLAHGYLAEVYLFKGMRAEAARHYRTAIGVADRLHLGWLRNRLESELGPKLSEADETETAGTSPRPNR
jgi:tetratricopeptide (TPR) repeat protein/DNA-binding MarR family transcriptional regulator